MMKLVTERKKLRQKSDDANLMQGKSTINKLRIMAKKLGNAFIGLGAIQIGIAKRVCIIKMGSMINGYINPVIIKKSGKQSTEIHRNRDRHFGKFMISKFSTYIQLGLMFHIIIMFE